MYQSAKTFSSHKIHLKPQYPLIILSSVYKIRGKSHEKWRVRAFKADRTTSKRIRYGFITVKSTTLIGLNSPHKNTTLPAIKYVEPGRAHILV
ncbi:hypothetical protein TNCV_4521741 [Trichonephila clavipes]|nr:hypothetical protein TNCV_4521741 [Trichonephila clavipes]